MTLSAIVISEFACADTLQSWHQSWVGMRRSEQPGHLEEIDGERRPEGLCYSLGERPLPCHGRIPEPKSISYMVKAHSSKDSRFSEEVRNDLGLGSVCCGQRP